ncbi:hypothetical protein PUR28_04430 [Streptomyces sp. BE308]|uniref:hypothetical protein n=1 Tax=unclassified Streptomyces TaxID=2593676 RepID=UPI002DD7E1B0|nr:MULTISPECIES: hypothetical protein [unclassified Streptomyces]MEE1790030.1 hypothetical protein [Streptomyces sp. BE308]WRZ75231.1 hypothetical protein OG251_28430 [Streptomyces sp. NBC_01237]
MPISLTSKATWTRRLLATAAASTALWTMSTTVAGATTTTVPYLCRSAEGTGAWEPYTGPRGFDVTAPATVSPNQTFTIAFDTSANLANPTYAAEVRDVKLVYRLPQNAVIQSYQLTGGNGLGTAQVKVKANGHELSVVTAGPLTTSTTLDLPNLEVTLTAPASGTLVSKVGGTSFTNPGYAFRFLGIPSNAWGQAQCYPDPAGGTTLSTITVV